MPKKENVKRKKAEAVDAEKADKPCVENVVAPPEVQAVAAESVVPQQAESANPEDEAVDVNETNLHIFFPKVLDALLKDHTTKECIIWATDDYREQHGEGYDFYSQITPEKIIGKNGMVIRPRTQRGIDRVKDMAEVFTPTWVCNEQNNLIDDAWFGRKNVFNEAHIDAHGVHWWKATEGKIEFDLNLKSSCKHSWQKYVRDPRMEITCGEGPYLVSRYDRVTGKPIRDLKQRVGIFDRKMRVVSERTETEADWRKWTKEALKATYGYEWQGDNLLLAREAMLFTVRDYYREKFKRKLDDAEYLEKIAYIISWNLWQMDGLKFVIPGSCETVEDPMAKGIKQSCPSCKKGLPYGHIGKKCLFHDWNKSKRDGWGKGEITFELYYISRIKGKFALK